MARNIVRIAFILLLIFGGVPLYAQDSEPAGDQDESSKQTEQTDESYRQQMELEDARDRDRTYIDNTYTANAEQEKIDKLPEESRDNIRDQLVDIIVENGEWEPKDALEEYPYTPTAAAEADPDLKQREQEAWEEQIEKYHEREAAAFGTHRGPVPGPGNPGGQEGGQQGQGGQQGGQQGGGQGDGSGDGGGGSGSAGTYQPYQSSSSSSEDEISTAGVSESALDFLRGGKGRQQPPPQGEEAQRQAQQQAQADAQALQEQLAQQQAAAQQAAAQEAAAEQESTQESAAEQEQEQAMAQESTDEQAEEEAQESAETVDVDTRGIIAIKDLDKLEGANGAGREDDQDDP